MAAETKLPATEDGFIKESSYEYMLQDVIRRHRSNSDLTVKVKDIKEVVPIGNNYLSTLHRVLLLISEKDKLTQEKTLIIKAFPKSELLQTFIKEGGIFETEIIMYNKILPKVNMVGSDVLGNIKFCAESFFTGQDNVLILEDLKQAGYKMADRHTGLDFDHCKVALTALARFHAISKSIADSDISFLGTLPESLDNEEKREKSQKFYSSHYTRLSEIVESWPEFERFGEKLREVGATAAEKSIELKDHNNTKLAVLNHGDFWVNNMLFKYSDTGYVEDVRFVDFQMAHFASPAIDLHYFLVTSPSDDVRNEGTDTLLEVYHSELCRALELLGCSDKVLSFDWLKMEIKDKMHFALHAASQELHFIVAEKDNIPDFSEMDEESMLGGPNSEMSKSLNGARFKQIYQKLLLRFEKEGIL